ncbi:MAG TPA: hypothetical protein VFD46_13630, partial [Chryseolinea sp.]|nr:hypothetical protein [Chryseolinea sp.]
MGLSTAVSLSSLSETEYLSVLIDYAVKENFSVALWRLPNEAKTHLVISKAPELLKYTATLEDLPPGFIVAPFEAAADRIYLKADYSVSFSNGQLNDPTTSLEASSNDWLANYVRENVDQSKSAPRLHFNHASIASTTDKDFFLRIVTNGLREIEEGSFEKVVLSRSLAVDLSDSFDVSRAFQTLCALYSNALISFVSIP